MTENQDPSTKDPNVLPYASPPPAKGNKGYEALAAIVFCVSAATVGIIFFGGANWPTAAIVACLAAVAIMTGHFITRR